VTVRGCTPVIDHDQLIPWNELDTCSACGRTLIPLNYLVPVHDHPLGDDRPNLKCPGCGTRYRWQAAADGRPA
jgi:hypothetical protein